MNDNLPPQEEHRLIKTMFQSVNYWKELLAGAKLRGNALTCDHIGMIQIKITVAEGRLLDLVPDNLLNELGF